MLKSILALATTFAGAFVLTLTMPAASYADSGTCRWDASKQLEDCLRFVAENHQSDGNCYARYNAAIRYCNSLAR